MTRISSITAGVLLCAIASQDAAAQWNVARFDTDRNRAYATFGMDPAMISSIGYGRVVRIAGHNFQISGDVGVVATSLDAQDFRTRLSAQTSVARWRSLHLTGAATFLSRGTENHIYRGFNFGADVTGTLGVYRRGWFAAGEAGYDKAIITHITHSDWYREKYFPEAKDGWYLDAGGTYRFGVASGLSLGATELVLRAGTQSTERWNSLTSPWYASLGLGVRY